MSNHPNRIIQICSVFDRSGKSRRPCPFVSNRSPRARAPPKSDPGIPLPRRIAALPQTANRPYACRRPLATRPHDAYITACQTPTRAPAGCSLASSCPRSFRRPSCPLLSGRCMPSCSIDHAPGVGAVPSLRLIVPPAAHLPRLVETASC